MRSLPLFAALGGGICAFFALLSPLFAIDANRVEETVSRLRRRKMQWELPAPEADSFDRPDLPAFDFLNVFLWILLGAAILFVVVFIAGSLRQRRGVDEGEALDLEGQVELSDKPLEAAEEAATRGDYATAIHLLLLGTIEEIRTSIGYDAPRWLTSREIARVAPLPDDARPPLESLIATVEQSYFGERPADATDYQDCVRWHGELRQACAGRKR